MSLLTIANASGIIAAVVFVVQLFVPLAIAFILVGFLHEEDSASTWSVLGRTLQSTHWPLLLNADTAARKGVRRAVYLISLAIPATLAVVAIASVVTPLGLYDVFQPGNEKELAPFQYVPDETAIGYGTPARSALPFNRRCYNRKPVNCPGSNNVIITEGNDNYHVPDGYSTQIAANVTETFDSGRARFEETVSSIWDIQWRSYITKKDPEFDNGTERIHGTFRALQPLILEDEMKAVEGLVVNMKYGGIGFRNHTAPALSNEKLTWSEDLLFIQPESVCVDTNLTLDFSIPDSQTVSSPEDLVLTDHGGFSQVNRDWKFTTYAHAQEELNLWSHAWEFAATNNIYTMFYLNVTNPAQDGRRPYEYLDSHIGKQFPLQKYTTVSPQAIRVDAMGSYLGQWGNSSFNVSDSDKGNYPNPWNITTDEFAEMGNSCRLALGGDNITIDNIGVACGLMYGAAKPRDGSDSNSLNPGTNWTIPLYGCATANKALIKTVNFSYNGSAGLKDLRVEGIFDKVYEQKQDRPLWAVEHREDLVLTEVKPLWGLVSPEFAGDPGITTIQREFLWLPETATDASFGWIQDNVAASQFHGQALTATFDIGGDDTAFLDTALTKTNDYSGQNNIALFFKWSKLTQSATSASNILNLVWTDLAANAVVGTRACGWSARPGAIQRNRAYLSPGYIVQVPVTLWERHLRYHVVYAIPAIIAAIIVLVVTATALTLLLLRRSGLAKLRWYLNHTSPGRVLTLFLYPDESQPQALTSEWLNGVGRKMVDLKHPDPRASSLVLSHGNDEETSSTNQSAVSLIHAGSNQGPDEPNATVAIPMQSLCKQHEPQPSEK